MQNVTFLSKIENCRVPSWEDIHRDVLRDGKGGLCLSLNVAFAAVVRAFGVHAHLVPADYVATNGRSVHAVTVFHLCTATSQSTCRCFEAETKAPLQRKKSCRDPCHRSPRLKQRRTDETQYPLQLLEVICKKSLQRSSLYLADVGCGFPTLRAINLREDIDKPFMDCGLEYCFRNKHQQYLRLHRAGDEVPEGEEVRNMKYIHLYQFVSGSPTVEFACMWLYNCAPNSRTVGVWL